MYPSLFIEYIHWIHKEKRSKDLINQLINQQENMINTKAKQLLHKVNTKLQLKLIWGVKSSALDKSSQHLPKLVVFSLILFVY